MTSVRSPAQALERGVLTNGRYRVHVSVAGAGGSLLGPWALNRWAGDATVDGDGWFLYVRDLESGACWSAGHQPVQHPASRYEARLGDDLVTIVREDEGIETRTDVRVDPARDIEWRRYTFTNRSGRTRRLSATTCIEVALNIPAADAGHPAFSKLFLQTELLPDLAGGALLVRRRPRSGDEEALVMVHALLAPGAPGDPQLETDRARFIGRGRTLAHPAAMESTRLSGTVGNVLDPVLCLRRELELPAGASFTVDGLLSAGTDRDLLLEELTAALEKRPAFDEAAADPAPVETLPPSAPVRYRAADGGRFPADASEPLLFFNGYGGFSEAGDEYVIRLDRDELGLRLPPQPWTNVVASPHTGFVASEQGLGFSWHGNSRERRLTPWHNDPVCDPQGETLYLRDEDEGIFWSPTPGPVPGTGSYEVRHGFGSTTWRHGSRELEQEVTAFVPINDPLKVVRLRVTNRASRQRRLSVFYCADWVLGSIRGPGTVTMESTAGGRLILARRTGDPSGSTAFAGVAVGAGTEVFLSGDRATFLGPYGTAARPSAVVTGDRLDGRTGPGLDACAAFQIPVRLEPGETRDLVFLLGEAADPDTATVLLDRFAGAGALSLALDAVRRCWTILGSGVHIETPAKALDLLVNGWLPYQTLSCRMWARSAFHQSGGAFGFRDQLQDAASLIHLAPVLTREQILLHAAHQFVEGDVLHWWHPPEARGIRTRFSDDLLWLPYITLFYLETTGDERVLDEEVRFLSGPELEPGQDERLIIPEDSGISASLFEHCCRAVDRSLTRGDHGLPLIGSGDWNDGMNRVGHEGRGESVWLGFFLYRILRELGPLCARRGDHGRARRYGEYQAAILTALNTDGWDGGWYRRAFYDDGTPIGAASSDEARIDAIAQAWAVLSGAAPPDRAALALDAMEAHLVDEAAGVIRLLAPPFDRTRHDPGYIKGYLPGVRENGGQYTHGALWAVRALAEAGRCERAAPLLEMLTPIRHTDAPDAVAVYQGEPYVVAADVYAVAPHVGRAGWTWYTGSSGWMFRVALESIVGLTVAGGRSLVLRPCVPVSWKGFTVSYRLPDGRTEYELVVRRGADRTLVPSEGRVEDGAVVIDVIADGRAHRIEIELGADVGPRYRAAEGAAQ